MPKLTVLVIATLLATAYTAAAASAKAHHAHSTATRHKPVAKPPVERPVTHLPVPPDAYRA